MLFALSVVLGTALKIKIASAMSYLALVRTGNVLQVALGFAGVTLMGEEQPTPVGQDKPSQDKPRQFRTQESPQSFSSDSFLSTLLMAA